jgi:cytochrome c oxidase assembly protein subunit 15
MEFSRRYIRFQWLTLIGLFLVICAGSFVRITGSGMGCPDWPKCFGKWIPPTAEEQLPSNYLSIFQEKRAKKAVKFCAFLRKLGMEETEKKIENDPTLLREEPFNAARTYTEYINRLLGFLAGNLMLAGFIWSILFYRKRWLLVLSAINLVLIAVEAWVGSIVVATNSPIHGVKIPVNKPTFYIWWAVFAITFYQMFLGTQVREYIDALTKQGLGREAWSNYFGMEFFIHRSFSWLVLVLLAYLAWRNERSEKISIIRWAFVVLGIELTAGVLLAYFDLPGLVQTAHLVFATVLLTLMGMGIFRFRRANQINPYF